MEFDRLAAAETLLFVGDSDCDSPAFESDDDDDESTEEWNFEAEAWVEHDATVNGENIDETASGTVGNRL